MKCLNIIDGGSFCHRFTHIPETFSHITTIKLQYLTELRLKNSLRYQHYSVSFKTNLKINNKNSNTKKVCKIRQSLQIQVQCSSFMNKAYLRFSLIEVQITSKVVRKKTRKEETRSCENICMNSCVASSAMFPHVSVQPHVVKN